MNRRRTTSTTTAAAASTGEGDAGPASRTRSRTGASQRVIAFDRKTHAPALVDGSPANILAMSAAAALRQIPEAAKEAMLKELTQIV